MTERVDIERLRALADHANGVEPDFGDSDFAKANWRCHVQGARLALAEQVPTLLDEIEALRAENVTMRQGLEKTAIQVGDLRIAPAKGCALQVWKMDDA